MTETSNSDFVTVMATVFKIVNDFFNKFPSSYIVFSGSDARRQRLYRIIISKEFAEITKTFDVFGIFGDTINKFELNKTYDLYLIKKKMRTKKNQLVPKLTGEQIVQQKLDRMNEMLKKVDLSKLPGRTEAK